MNDLQLKLILKAIDKASPELKKVEAGVNRVGSSTKKATASSKGFSASIGSAGIAAAAAVAAAVLIKMGTALIDVAREMQGLNAAMVTATGSERAATDEMNRLLTFAEKTPYQINEVVGAFIKLKNLGLDPSEAAMRSYGNTASSMNKSLDQMIEAVADAATGEFERLKEFGIKARQNGDSVKLTFRGVTTEIKNSAEAIEGYLRRIGEVEFAGGMDRQMATINGTISNFKDSWMQMLDAIGETGAIDGTARAIKTLTGGMKQLTNSMRLLAELKQGNVGFFDWLFADDEDAKKILETIKNTSAVGQAVANAKREIEYLEGMLKNVAITDQSRQRWIKEEINYLKESIAELEFVSNAIKELESAANHTAAQPVQQEDNRKTSWSKKEIDAYAKVGKGILGDWEKLYRDRETIQKNSLNVQMQLEKEAAELNKVVWEASKDFWQLKEEDEWTVRSRAHDDEMALNKATADAMRKQADEMMELLGAEQTAMERLAGSADDLGWSFSSAFEDAIIKGGELGDVLQGLAEDIQRIMLRSLITQPLASAFASGISGLFSPTTYAMGSQPSAAFGPALHDGGRVVPRFHFGGLASDEVPAVLQTGETVLDREHTRKFDMIAAALDGGKSGGGTTIRQTIQVDARGSSVSAADLETAVERGARQGYQAVYDDIDGRGPISRRIG